MTMAKKPNILFIMTDQQRSDTIHALGNQTIRTPVLDSLVAEGTTFTNCYTPSPVCVAGRSATITGTPPHINRCTSNNESPMHLRSIMQVLKAQGYYTHGIAKMHFNPDTNAMWGFDSRDVSEEGARQPDGRNDFHQYLDDNGYGHVLEPQGIRSEMYYIPQPSQLPPEHHHTTWVADRAIDFLGQHDDNQPFFLWASFIKPHPPFESPSPWNKLYRTADMMPPFRPEGFETLLTYWNHFQNRYKYRDHGYDELLFRTIKAMYYASISFIDYNVGRILEALGDDIDNTLIVYTSDHGEMLGDYGSVGKRTMLNPSVNIPMIVRWQDKFEQGKQVNTPVTLVDLFPTFANASGSDEPLPSAEGQDLQQIASGDTERQYAYSQFSEKEKGLYMIVSREYKYIYSAADRKEWLFDLGKDPQETKNWADNPRYADITSELRTKLIKRFADDNYDHAVDGDSWRIYDPPPFPDVGSDEGLLFQDAPHLDDILSALDGYYGD